MSAEGVENQVIRRNLAESEAADPSVGLVLVEDEFAVRPDFKDAEIAGLGLHVGVERTADGVRQMLGAKAVAARTAVANSDLHRFYNGIRSDRNILGARSAMKRLAILFLVVAASVASAQNRKPTAISTESVPNVPAEISDRLKQYGEFRAASFAGWAPDGKGMLISTRFGNTNQLFRVYEPMGRREQVTFFNEPAAGKFLNKPGGGPSGDLVVSLNPGGSENFQIYFVEAATGKSHLVTDGKSRNGLGPVRKDGSRAVVMSNARNGKDVDLYVMDPRRPGSMTLLMEGTGDSWQATDWSEDGYRLLLVKYLSINESYPFVFDMLSRKLSPIPLPTDKPAAYTDLHFSKDGASVYLATDARGEFRELAKVNLENGKYDWLSEGLKGNVEEIELAEGNVVFTANVDGYSSLNFISAKHGIRYIVPSPRGMMSGLEYNESKGLIACTLSSPNAPSDVITFDCKNGVISDAELADAVHQSRSIKTTMWTLSETGGLPRSLFSAPELVKFKSFDGREIPAFVNKPKLAKGKKAAVVINIHGGPESQHRPMFSAMEQFLVNDLGIAVIAPNVRGSDGYGKTYLLLDNGPKREDSVKDIGALLDWVAKQPDLDASRVSVMGGSYGGYMVLACLTHFPDRIKAGVDIVGIANFITFLEKTAGYRRDLRRAEYGDERNSEMRAVFQKISPANNVDKIKSALLVIHGKNDPRVPFFEAEQIAAKVRESGKPVWTVFADNEGHGFAKKENRDYMNDVVAMFLKENLKESSSGGPSNGGEK
jgi:dienelactone hydrolase